MANKRKQQIIRAAVKRFARHGSGKTTLEEIARDIRIGKATIYHYFESKDELFFASLKWETDEKEKEIMKNMLKREEEIVKLVLSSIYSSRLEGMNESLPNFIVTSSWGAFFGNRINHISHPDRVLNTRDFMFKSLENILS